MNHRSNLRKDFFRFCLGSVLIISVIFVAQTGLKTAWAKPAQKPVDQPSPLHPTFPLLDENGENVLTSGAPVSTMQTCGSCHNTEFIESHSFHTSIGLNEFTQPGLVENGHEWDTSTGLFGKWNPLLYRYLSPVGDERIDIGTPAWLELFGVRHVGGGPAVYSREGGLLTDLVATPDNPETAVYNPDTGVFTAWDWKESGTIEMNCFLCHTMSPNNETRKSALEAGLFKWANTATLEGTGIVEYTNGNWEWNQEAFEPNGDLSSDFIHIQDPTNENCGLCHGLVHDELKEPLVQTGCTAETWRTETTGQIISPQKLSDSGMNLAEKETLNRSWDIHAERLLDCTDCHFSLNNPVYFQENETTRPDHLVFDPRRLDLGEYLYEPVHQFARGESAQSTIAPELKDTMRRCESCHDAENTHTWLPYTDRHMNALDCESCHIPKIYSTSLQQYDWTAINLDSQPKTECRGIVGPSGSITSLITGYNPVLLPRTDVDGNSSLAPYNLITSWYWVYGSPERPVRLQDLEAAWLDGEDYAQEVIAVFDKDQDGILDKSELVIDNSQKEAVITGRLVAVGLENPHIVGEIQPYSINHDVAAGEWATKDCQTCHSESSRINQPFTLSGYIPGGVIPAMVKDSNTSMPGEIKTTLEGALVYEPSIESKGLYILGKDNVKWIDTFGALVFLGAFLGIFMHGGLRFYASLKQPNHTPELKRVYMYSTYERFWHWLQTFTILLLIFTGLVIHRPDTFGIFSFRGVVLVHNILATILLINAALSLFYHLASGEIKQYIPRPQGFFDQAISQGLFYLHGIFRGEEHPFEKSPEKKLNPLQQITYFGILNVLLPLQVITGALMWGVQRWPDLAASLGGLPFLAPFHTLIAWLFATFVVGHVYLTTTGHAPLAGIKSMIMGWDELEKHVPPKEEAIA